jgi:2-polyprenyl-6-methoxyphenol hydroxylase-like FAD-dependent oxidoreductase
LDADIIIVGGGVAGLGAALALAQYPLSILVVERRARVGGIHRGDSLLPKAVAQLTSWGLRDALDAAGARPIRWMEVHAPGGRLVFQTPLTPPGAEHPYLVLPHARLEEVLMARALAQANIRVVRPASFVAVERDAETGRVRGVRCRRGDAVELFLGQLVVAADGQHSLLRHSLGLSFDAYRYDHAYLGLEAERPPAYRDAMRLHFHSEGGVLLMPHPERIGVGMLVESGSAKRWLNMGQDALSAKLAERAPILRGMALNTQGAHVYELTRAHVRHYARDGVALIGDAAHCTNPTAGQGMAMALTDAGALGDALGRGWSADPRVLDGVLADFAARQWPANQRQVENSHRLARLYALRGPVWTRLKLWAVRGLTAPALRRITDPVISSFIQP